MITLRRRLGWSACSWSSRMRGGRAFLRGRRDRLSNPRTVSCGRRANPSSPAIYHHGRERHGEHRQGEESADREPHLAGISQSAPALPGSAPAGPWRATPPAESRRNKPVIRGRVAEGNVERGQREHHNDPGSTNNVPAIKPPPTPFSTRANRSRSPAAAPRVRAAACSSSARARTVVDRSSASRRPESAASNAICPAGPPKVCRLITDQVRMATRSGMASLVNRPRTPAGH